jgi:hypothetical protein
MTVTLKRSNNPHPTRNSDPAPSARTDTTVVVPPDATVSTTTETTADDQGKLPVPSTHSYPISSPLPVNISLSSSATSDHNLTNSSISTQSDLLLDNDLVSDDDDQWGSFQQETFPGPLDPSITRAMRIRRDNGNASSIAIIAETAQTTFLECTGPCIGRARSTSIVKSIKSGFACVDSGATHHMSNGVASDFSSYKSLPKGSHVLVADNHLIECLGIGTQLFRINNHIIG